MTKLNTQRLSLRQLASRKRVAPSSVSSWVEAGCPRNPDGTFNEAHVDAWLAKHRQKAADSKSLKERKIQAEIDRIQRDIEKRDLELQRERGEVHSRVDCAKSLTFICSERLQPLLGIHSRIRVQFPELPPAVPDAIQREVDVAFDAIRASLGVSK